MSGTPPVLVHLALGPDDPPDWCFDASPTGQLPTCTYSGGQWHRSYDTGGGAPATGVIVLVTVVAILVVVAGVVWRTTTARRMARAGGLSEADATAMSLLTENGLEATYLAASLRPTPAAPAASGRPSAERLQELTGLLGRGLITQDEHDARRRAILDAI